MLETWFPILLLGAIAALAAAVLVAGGMILRAVGAASNGARNEARGAIAWQQRAQEALDAVPDWVVMIDEGLVVDSNAPRRCPFDGAGLQAIGKPMDSVFPTEGVDVLKEHVTRALKQGRPLSFEFLYGGGVRYAETRVFPLHGSMALVVTRDHTEQRSKEETLHRSKERFALAVQGANDGLWDWDLETDEVYYSYQFKSIVGLDPSEAINRPAHWFDRVHPDDRAGVRTALEAHFGGEAARFESEHRVRAADGSWLWVLARGMAVRGATGAPRRIAGSITDLTNRRVVAVSQEKANLLQHATESVGIGVAIVLGDGSVRVAGDHLSAMTAEWRDLGEWWNDVCAEAARPEPVPCPTCGEPHHVGTVLAEVYRPDTDAFPVGSVELLSRVFELAWAGHAHEIGADDAHVLMVKDVTAKTRAERRLFRANEELVVARDQALAASRAKSAFLANMSHELRTPLNHILGYAEMVQEELEEEGRSELARDLDRVRDSGAHLLDLISGILDLSRVEAGLSGLEVQTFDLRALIDEVVQRRTNEIARNQNRLVQDLPPDLGQMTANTPQVRRIVDELLSNAAKFTNDGTITLSVEALVRVGRDWLVLTIRDTGQGMAPEQVKALFAEFTVGDDSSTRAHGGAGLGLTLVQRFTDMMGGSIDVSSRPGEGSVFRVTLPREVGGPDPETEETMRLVDEDG